MAILNTWKLPLNPPNPNPFYLQFLTSELKGRLYYTKYIIDVIGELSVSSEAHNVREWTIPGSLFAFVPRGLGGNPKGITYGPDWTIWAALENGQRLIRLDPESGTLTSYGATHGGIGSPQYNNYPISCPTDVMFDRDRNAWYIGSGLVGQYRAKGPLIGRLNADRKSADIWELRELSAALAPGDLWVRNDGEEIWFTLNSDQKLTTMPFLGRLQPSMNRVTFWTYPPPQVIPLFKGAVGIVGDSPTKPDNIWFTFYDATNKIGTYRLELSTHIFFHYSSGSMHVNPKQIALARNGDAWISDWSGQQISTVRKDIYCDTTEFSSKTLSIRPRNMSVDEMKARVKPKVHTVVPVRQNVKPVESRCITDFPMPYGTNPPNGIAVNDTPNNPTVYFSQGSGIIIGQLMP